MEATFTVTFKRSGTKLPEGRASLQIFSCTVVVRHSILILQSAKQAEQNVQRSRKTGQPAPTIESCDPEDLCDINSNDVQSTGSSLCQESDHHFQKLSREGRKQLKKTLLTKKTDNILITLIIMQRRSYTTARWCRLRCTV